MNNDMKTFFTLFFAASSILAWCQAASQKTPGEQGIVDFETAPRVKWKVNTRGPLYGSPVVDGTSVYAGGLDSTFYALEVESGKLLWKFRTKGSIRSTAAIDQNRIFILSRDGNLYALDKNSGKVLWTFATKGEKTYSLYGYADYYTSSPVVSDGIVYFGSGDGSVYALKSETGARIWSFQTSDVVHTTPALDKDKLFVGSFDGYFYAINRLNGKLIWKFKSVGQHFFPKGEFQGSPVVAPDHGLVFVGSRDFNLYALDIEKGYCHWNKRYTSWALALTYRDQVLYAGTADDDTMYAYEGLTGKELWKTNVKFNIFGPAVIGPNQIYFGTQQGKLLSLDRKTGALKWTFKTDGYTAQQPEYFKSEDNFVKNEFYARVFKEGVDHYIKVLEQLGAVYSTPVIGSDYILFTSADGGIYCLSR